MLGIPMLLSGVGTLETDVTKPLSAMEKITQMHHEHGPVYRGTKNVFTIRLSYLNMAAVVTWVESGARCSGLAPCWGPELQEQVGAALLVDPPEQSALKQLGRSSSHHLSGGGSTLLSDVTRQEVLLLLLLMVTKTGHNLQESAAQFYNCPAE